ncbi:IS4 family transposase, partial [Lactobacillus delbrueckii subsp. bulgaricus]|nr:IS4 family transposase [Lactobacillus delbrueckii subsp. bulgaricus]
WDIEVFFKTCKSFLKLGTEYHGLSYDALTAHTAFVFLRYMFMSVEKRDDEDDRAIGELFYCMADELADIIFNYSLQTLVEAMFESVKENRQKSRWKGSPTLSFHASRSTCKRLYRHH